MCGAALFTGRVRAAGSALKLGEGSFGTVYLAKKTTDHMFNSFALKEISVRRYIDTMLARGQVSM